GLLRRRRRLGLDRRVREHHRGLLGGPGRLARVRLAAGARPRRPLLIPLAQPVLGPREEELVLEVLRSGQLSLGPMLSAFEEGFARRLGVAHASAVSSGTAGLHLALRAVGVTDGDEVVTSPFSFVASANAIVYERATPVFVDIDPVTLNVPAVERLGLPIVEDAAEALGATFPDGVPVGARGHPAVFGFYANKQLATGEGGIVTTADAAIKERIDSERNQGRAPDMGWLDHDRLGFNYRLTDVACAIGLAQLERLDGLLADRARVAGWYREALADLDGLGLPCRDAGGNVRGWFVFVVQVPRGRDRDEVVRALREHGIASKPYLPAIHLMTYYRETF